MKPLLRRTYRSRKPAALLVALGLATISVARAHVLQVAPPQALAHGRDSVAAARRIAATLRLAAQEYRLAWSGDVMVNIAEWEEARLFLRSAREASAQLPPALGGEIDAQLGQLEGAVAARVRPDSVARAAQALERRLSAALGGIALDERAPRAPSLASGERIYRQQCAGCHGEAGRGDGPVGLALEPPPADLTAPAVLATATPLDWFRRVTHGVPGTGMPAYEGSLSAEERWDAVAFVFALTDSLARRGGSGSLAVVFGTVRGTLGAALEALAQGDAAGAAQRALDAYMAFEAVEAPLGATDPRLVARLEEQFGAVRVAAARADTAAVRAGATSLFATLDAAEGALVAGRSPIGLFAESLMLMLREGFEAILVIGAIMAVLAKAGAHRRRRTVRWGIASALAASLLTAAIIEWIFRISAAQREALEGIVMLVAAATLFYVSYWLISKVEIAAWTRFVKGQIQRAVESGSALALAGVAFLAVYREGFETVLFYKALFVTGGAGGAAPITAGIVAGLLALVAVYVGIERFGLKVPMRPFFAVTGATLSYMAFVFAGRGVRELQEGGYVGLTPVPGAPANAFLGIYPTAETLTVQAAILLALAVALVWTFAVRPRRLAARGAAPASSPPERESVRV